MKEGRRSFGDALVFAALAGLASTFLHGYYCGRYNEVCQLPLLLHALDPNCLARDFFVVKTFESFGPRFFYIRLLTFPAKLLSVPVLFVILTWLQNAVVAFATYLAAKEMFARSDFAAAVATTIVMSVASVELGRSAYLFISGALPASLALGPALLSLWQGIKCRPLASALLALVAIPIHPLVGIGAALLGLAACGLSSLFGLGITGRSVRLRTFLLTLVMAVVLTAAVGLFWSSASGERIMNNREYVMLFGWFRNPHHVFFSFFPKREWVAMGFFFAAAVFSWVWWYRQSETNRPLALRVALVAGLLLLLWLGGYLFVEAWPSRLWATFQVSRYVFVMKWLGLMLFAGTIVRLAQGEWPEQPVVASLLFLPTGFAHPHVVLWGHVVEVVRRWLKRYGGFVRTCFLAGTVLFGVAVIIFTRRSNTEMLTLAVLAGAVVIWMEMQNRLRRYLAAAGIVLVTVAVVIVHKYRPIRPLEGLLRGTQPLFQVEDIVDSQDQIAAFCRRYTPSDAIFLIPPHFERFRASARRAVVIDFKCTLVSDAGLLAWRQRLADCYGEISGRGFPALAEMNANYRRITEDQLLQLADKYGVNFAVLHRETPTDFPVIYANVSFKVVIIPPVSSSVSLSS